MKNDLLPCPFCGGGAMQKFDDSTPPPLCEIRCKKCQATIHFRPLYHAITAWNTRPEPEPRALTFNEIIGGGAPIWVENIGWCVYSDDDDGVFDNKGCFNSFSVIENYRCYDRQPKGEK